MICTVSGKAPKYCKPTLAMYNRGCRCEEARRLHREYMRGYLRARRKTVCPLCASETSRASGFCRECEGKL